MSFEDLYLFGFRNVSGMSLLENLWPNSRTQNKEMCDRLRQRIPLKLTSGTPQKLVACCDSGNSTPNFPITPLELRFEK